jgi:hypothetical protein
MPPGAVEVARNAAASQAFLLRRNLAVQFHPEMTPGMLTGWLDNGGAAKAAQLGIDIDALTTSTRAEADAAARRARSLVDGFVKQVTRR